MEQEFKEEAYNIRRMLEHFSLALAHHLDEIQMAKFGEVIDEIGIDVGLDQNQKFGCMRSIGAQAVLLPFTWN